MLIPFKEYIKELNSNEKYEYVVKKYPKISKEDFLDIVKADPTSIPEKDGIVPKVGTYVDWLLKIFASEKLKEEDLYKATEYLEIFNNKKQKLDVALRDINKYDSLTDLFTKAVKQLKDVQSKTERKQEKLKDADLVFENDEWKIIVPKTYAASCAWGSGSEWCTASGKTQRFYNMYTEQGPLYIIINKENPKVKYQFHFESEQFMDVDDKRIIDEMKYLPVALKKFGKDISDFFHKTWKDKIEKQKIDEDKDFYLIKKNKTVYYKVSKKNIFDVVYLTDLSGAGSHSEIPENFMPRIIKEKLEILKRGHGELFNPVIIDKDKNYIKFELTTQKTWSRESTEQHLMIPLGKENGLLQYILNTNTHMYTELEKKFDNIVKNKYGDKIEKKIVQIFPGWKDVSNYRYDNVQIQNFKDALKNVYWIKDENVKEKLYKIEIKLENFRDWVGDKKLNLFSTMYMPMINKSIDFNIVKEDKNYYGIFDYKKHPEWLFGIGIGMEQPRDRRKKKLEPFYNIDISKMMKDVSIHGSDIAKIQDKFDSLLDEYMKEQLK